MGRTSLEVIPEVNHDRDFVAVKEAYIQAKAKAAEAAAAKAAAAKK